MYIYIYIWYMYMYIYIYIYISYIYIYIWTYICAGRRNELVENGNQGRPGMCLCMSMYVPMCVCMYAHVLYIFSYVCVFVSLLMHVAMFVCLYVYACTPICVCVYTVQIHRNLKKSLFENGQYLNRYMLCETVYTYKTCYACMRCPKFVVTAFEYFYHCITLLIFSCLFCFWFLIKVNYNRQCCFVIRVCFSCVFVAYIRTHDWCHIRMIDVPYT